MKDYSAMSDFEINCAVEFGHNSDFQAGPTHCSFSVDENSTTTVGIKFYQDSANGYKDYCNNPADAWPIITANHIGIMPFKNGGATAWPTSVGLLSNAQVKHENPLRCAMIVYLQMMEQKS